MCVECVVKETERENVLVYRHIVYAAYLKESKKGKNLKKYNILTPRRTERLARIKITLMMMRMMIVGRMR
jgi:hypothetical protein